MPSIDAEARKLWSKFSAVHQAGTPMVERVNDCMTVRNQRVVLGETVPYKQFVDKLLNVDRELAYLRPTLVRASMDEIMAGLTDGYTTTTNTGRIRTCKAMPAGATSDAETR